MLKKILTIISLIILNFQSAFSQVFGNAGDTIPDDGTSIDFLITVSGLPNTIDTVSFGVETICINLVHTYDSDLDISLIAPDGTQVILTSGNGGGGDNYIGTCFNQSAPNSIVQGSSPFTGNYRPQGQMGIVNNGQNPNGIWRLHILDTYPFADIGYLFYWSIGFGNNPATYSPFVSSNLPIAVINTFGQGIPNDPKITARLGIIDNGTGIRNYMTDSFNVYNGWMGIETRGHSSQSFPQKQYSFETRDSLGNNLDVSLLNMPAEHDWILYAPYTDKSCMRNWLTYKLSNDMGLYAARGKFCEVVINGEYKGIYEITETIKRDANRVNIAKLTANDTIGDDVTGGYIVKIDWVDGPYWVSSYPPDQTNPWNNVINFQCTSPKPDSLLPQQQNYIEQYVDSFEDALASPLFADPVTGWRNYTDELSVIDFFILNEISKNVDGYRLSSFFNKDKNSNFPKIKMGPVWDFNLAWHNADYCNNEVPSEWAYKITDYCATDVPFWWKRFMLDVQFRNHLKCRWTYLRSNVLDTTYIFNYIDSIASLLDESQQRHFVQYPILGVYVWPNPSPLATTYYEEIDYLKQWIIDRIIWMDVNIPGTCSTTGEEENSAAASFTIYPNPANNMITVDAFHNFKHEAKIIFYDVLGKIISEQTVSKEKIFSDAFRTDIHALQSGIYFIRVWDGDETIGMKKLVKRY
ncbi:MAG: CotH kinase family protein [Bacteroidia bacterium]